jgi:hypothetical protein
MMSLLAIIASSVYAQAIPPLCDAAFTRGISNNYEVFTSESNFNDFHNRLCQASFKTYQSLNDTGGLGISIPLTDGLLGLNGDFDAKSKQFNQSYQNFCQNIDYSAAEQKYGHSLSSEINSVLVQSWNSCIQGYFDAYVKTQAAGVFIDVSPNDYKTMEVSVRQNPFNAQPVKIRSFPIGIACYFGGKQFALPYTIPGNLLRFGMTCEKDPHVQKTFSVTTNLAQSNQITLPAMPAKIPSEPLNILNDQVNLLKQQVTTLQAQTSDLQAQRFVVEDAPNNAAPPPFAAAGDFDWNDHSEWALAMQWAGSVCVKHHGKGWEGVALGWRYPNPTPHALRILCFKPQASPFL